MLEGKYRKVDQISRHRDFILRGSTDIRIRELSNSGEYKISRILKQSMPLELSVRPSECYEQVSMAPEKIRDLKYLYNKYIDDDRIPREYRSNQ